MLVNWRRTKMHRNGDIMQSVNGQAIVSVAVAIKLYQDLHDAPEITLTVLRGNQSHTLDYRIR